MIDGQYKNRAAIYFGPSMETHAWQAIADLGVRRLLLHYGRESAMRSGLHQRVVDQIRGLGIDIVELGGVRPNPTLAMVRQGIALCRERAVDFVLAIGGGSVIDSAKAIAAGACHDGDVLELIDGRHPPQRALPIGTVLTCPGSGSESSPAAVITDSERQLKLDFAADCLTPVISVLNPANTLNLNLFQTRCGIVDATTHILERYFSNTSFVEVSDRLCEGLLASLMHYGCEVGGALDSYDVRAEIMWACKLAHDDVAGLGRKQDWSSHTIAHALGGHFDRPHGPLVCVVMLAWMKLACERNPAKLAQFASRLFGVAADAPDAAIEGVRRFEQWLGDIGMPTRLTALDMPHDPAVFTQIAEMCARRNPSGTIGNYMRIGRDDVVALLDIAHGN